MTHITDQLDPAFRYEDLARFTFDNCGKFGDPWHYAAQEVYSNFTSGIEIKGRRIFSTILNKLIYDNRHKEDICQKLIQIEDSIWYASTQQDAIKVVNETILIFENP